MGLNKRAPKTTPGCFQSFPPGANMIPSPRVRNIGVVGLGVFSSPGLRTLIKGNAPGSPLKHITACPRALSLTGGSEIFPGDENHRGRLSFPTITIVVVKRRWGRKPGGRSSLGGRWILGGPSKPGAWGRHLWAGVPRAFWAHTVILVFSKKPCPPNQKTPKP